MNRVTQRHGQTQAGNAGRPAQYHYVEHDQDSAATLEETLVHAVSDVSGADTRQVQHAVSRQVNVEALNWLFRETDRASSTALLAFEVFGRRVSVNADGGIYVA